MNDSGLREKIKHRLESITIPTATFEARVKRQGERMQASLVSVVPVYDAPPENDDEEFRRRIVASQSGRIELLGHFAEDGQLLDFFAHQKQRNLLNLFFAMPALPVSQGSSWELDVKLTEVGPGFHFEYADRMRDAFLDQVYEVNGENVAQLFYVVSEEISGYFKPGLDDDKMPVESRISHIAYGEFLVDQGKWALFTMVAYTTGSGLSKNESMMIYALRP